MVQIQYDVFWESKEHGKVLLASYVYLEGAIEFAKSKDEYVANGDKLIIEEVKLVKAYEWKRISEEKVWDSESDK